MEILESTLHSEYEVWVFKKNLGGGSDTSPQLGISSRGQLQEGGLWCLPWVMATTITPRHSRTCRAFAWTRDTVSLFWEGATLVSLFNSQLLKIWTGDKPSALSQSGSLLEGPQVFSTRPACNMCQCSENVTWEVVQTHFSVAVSRKPHSCFFFLFLSLFLTIGSHLFCLYFFIFLFSG